MPLKQQLTAAFVAAACLTCGDSTGPGGGSVTLGNGTLRTFLTKDASGNPTAIGATFSAGLLTGLPAVDTFMTVALPGNGSGTVFTHLYFDYVPHGHEPAMVYDTAHFDFHFYFISDAQRAAIATGPDSVTVPAQYIPADYKKVSQVIGGMGVHRADSTNPEFTSGVAAYTKSFVYGYHQGQFQFYDIMITKTFLESQTAVNDSINQPAAFPAPGYYPTTWRLTYDAARQEYRVALEGFVQR